MHPIKVHDQYFKPYLREAQIHERISAMGQSISKEYQNNRPLFIAILNGAFMFASDLFKEVSIEAEISFIKLASYKGVKSTGQVITAIGLDEQIEGRHVIVLEDIIDTGKTLSAFLPQLLQQRPASLKVAALLHKPEATVHPVQIDYLGFTVPHIFLLGYGLDYDGLGRNLREIYQLTDPSS